MSKYAIFPVLAALCLVLALAGCKTTSKKPADPGLDPSKMSAEELEKMGDGLVSQRGKAVEALGVYAKALEKGGDPGRLKYKQGFVLLREGEWASALARFDESLAAAPEDVQTLQGAAYCAFKLGDYGQAEARLSRAVAMRPDLPGAHNLLGIMHNQLKRPELAVADFKAAIALSGSSPDLQNNLGISYFMIRDYVRAEQALRLALSTGPNPRAANNLGLALCRQKKFDEAFAAFKQAGGEAAAFNNTGVCYADEGNKAKAMEYFNKAVELSPKYYAAAERNLSQTSGQPGGHDAASEVLTIQASPAGDLAPSAKVTERALAPEPEPKKDHKAVAPVPSGPAASTALPLEAAAPHEWPGHAPLKAKAESQGDAAQATGASKDKTPASPDALASAAPLQAGPAPEAGEAKAPRPGKEAKGAKEQARQAKQQPVPAQPPLAEPAPAPAEARASAGQEAAPAQPNQIPAPAGRENTTQPATARTGEGEPGTGAKAPEGTAKPAEAAPAPGAGASPQTPQAPASAASAPESAAPVAQAEGKSEPAASASEAKAPGPDKPDKPDAAAPVAADAAPAWAGAKDAKAGKPSQTEAERQKKSKPEAGPAESKGGRVLGLSGSLGPDGYRVVVATDAPVGKAEAFAKKSPPAVGVDLFGKWKAPAPAAVAGGEEFVEKVRVGAHEDKLRIMIDLKSDQIRRKPALEILPNGVVILFGTSR
jgi:Flp pilus assembly protein TadD